MLHKLLLLAVCSSLHTHILAQQPLPATPDTLQEVTVEGQRIKRHIQSATPQQTFTQRMLWQRGLSQISDALHLMAGTTLRDYGGVGGLKTLSVRGIGSRHTAVVYDGFPLSDCQTGEIDLSRYTTTHLSEMKLYLGDNDELMLPARAAASAAILALNHLTKPADSLARPRLNAQLSTGSWGMLSPAWHYEQRLSRHTALSCTGEYLRADNHYPFILHNLSQTTHEKRTNSDIESGHTDFSLHTQWRWGESWSKVYYYQCDRNLPGITHLYKQENGEQLQEKNAMVQAGVRNLHNQKWQWQLQARWNWAYSSYHNAQPSGGIRSATYWQREWYATASVKWKPIKAVALSYSADYAANGLNATYGIFNHPHRNTLWQTVSTQWHCGRMTANARLLVVSSDSIHRLSPSASISLRLLPQHHLYLRAQWKEVFRLPSFNELYYQHIGPTDLQPENTRQLGIGITWQQQCRTVSWNLTVDDYANRVTDKIVAIPFNLFVWRMMNLATVHGSGTDLTAQVDWQLHPHQSILILGNFSLQHIKNRTNATSPHYGKQIAYTPCQTFGVSLIWNNPWLTPCLTAHGTGAQWSTNEHVDGTRLPTYSILDLAFSREFPVKQHHISVSLSLQNLLDKQYEVVARYPMPGRSWRITASFQL